MLERIKFNLICTLVVCVSWILLFKLNLGLFSKLQLSDLIAWVFLPSGLRLLATLLLRYYAIPGLFVGAMIMGFNNPGLDTVDLICISTISAVTPYLAYHFVRSNLSIQASFKGMTSPQLILISAIFALFSASMHNIYFYFFLDDFYNVLWLGTFEMFIGDFIGSILILFIFSLSIKLIRKIVSTSNIKNNSNASL